ncbi:MAG: transcriptional repressor [Niabella sp.]
MKQNVAAYLKQKGIYVTPARLALLLVFIKHKEALSHRQLFAILNGVFNRVTLYRALELFLQKEIIHILPGIKGTSHYTLSANNASQAFHHKKHLHFICKVCGKTTCFESIPTPSFHLPEGFIEIDTEVIVQGICCSCQNMIPHITG